MKMGHMKYSACIAGFLSSACYFLYYALFGLHTTSVTNISHSQYISTETQENVSAYLSHLMKISKQPSTWYRLLQKKFPGIIKIRRNTFATNHEKIYLLYDLPLVIVKQAHETPVILTRCGHMVPISYYSADMIANLPYITITHTRQNERELNDLYKWVNTLNYEFYDHFCAFWESTSKIMLHDLSDNKYTYIIEHTTPISLLNSPHIAQIKEVCAKKKYKKWNIDLRFQDYYIAQGIL